MVDSCSKHANSEFLSDTKAHQTAAVGDCLYQCAGSCSGTCKLMLQIVHKDA